MTNKTINDANLVTNLADDDMIPNWDTSAGQQARISAANARAYMQTGLSGFVKEDGTVALTGDWDIGSGRKIKADQIQARSASGLKLYEATSAKGLFVQDTTGYVGVGHNSPARLLHVIDTTYVGGWIAGKLASVPVSLATTSNHTGSLILTEETNQVGLHIGVVSSGNYDTYLQARWMTASSPASNILLNPLGGSVGIKTTGPATALHVVETGTSLRGIMSAQHNTATTPAMLKLRKSRGSEASPTTVASADILGMIQPNGHDGTAYRDAGSITFVVDSSVSTSNVPTGILFNTTTSNGDGTERMRIRSDGSITIGGLTLGDTLVHIYQGSAGTVAASASTNLTVEGSGDNGISLLCPNANINAIYYGSPANATAGQIGYLHSTNTMYFLANGTEMDINSNAVFPATDNTVSSGKSGKRWSAVWAGNGTIQTSDMRMKQQTQKSNLDLSFILALKPLKWVWADAQYGRVHHGLAAQDVKQVMDEQHTGDFGGYIYDPETDIHSLRYNEFIAPIITAIQQLSERIQSIEASIQGVKA